MFVLNVILRRTFQMINDDIIGDYARKWPHPKLTWEDAWINKAGNMRGVRLSSINNEIRMERLVQDALDEGYSDEEALVIANKRWDNFVDNIHDDEEEVDE